MAFDLQIMDEAEAETMNGVDYYGGINKLLADQFLEDLITVYKKIAAHPAYYKYIPRKKHDHYRYTKLRRFPFIVIFRAEETAVVVYRVFNTNRKPDYHSLPRKNEDA